MVDPVGSMPLAFADLWVLTFIRRHVCRHGAGQLGTVAILFRTSLDIGMEE
jgi:hypothetical protein